jgi:hypothetical protein
MYNITLISTMHKQAGRCNPDELYLLLKEKSPNVVFVEALESTYTNYDMMRFSAFGLYHSRVEIAAFQRYPTEKSSIEYVPVLDIGLSDPFSKKYEQLCENSHFREMLDEYYSLALKEGFQFLNSQLSMTLHQKMRVFEKQILNNDELIKAVDADINDYENSMLQNIYSYCRIHQFERAVFLCGSAHRQSIIEKIRNFSNNEKVDINWLVYGEENETKII